jgi:hypothetical protein
MATPPEDSYSVYRLLFVAAIYATLAALSLTAGLLLWTENRKGVVLAKTFLMLLSLLPSTLDVVLAATRFKIDAVSTIQARAIAPTIWLLYLQTSDRVHATYET